MTKFSRLTVDGMRSVLKRIEALKKEGLSDEEFEAKGRAIFAEQRIIDASLIEAFRVASCKG